MSSLHGIRRAILLAWLLAFVPGSAKAVSIVEASRSTFIRAWFYDDMTGEYTLPFSEVDPVGYGAWSSELSEGDLGYLATATQSSLIDEWELSGTGGVGVIVTYNYAKTLYHVVFAVDAATPYELTVANVYPGCCSYGGFAPQGSVRLDRVDPGDPALVLESIHDVSLGMDFSPWPGWDGFPDFAGQGVLEPGTYAFDFELHYNGSHLTSGPGDADFALVMIPEPGTLALVGAVLAAWGLQRRRRR